MNGTAQRTHTTAVQTLETRLENAETVLEGLIQFTHQRHVQIATDAERNAADVTARLTTLDTVLRALIPLLQVDGAFVGVAERLPHRNTCWGRLTWLVTGR